MSEDYRRNIEHGIVVARPVLCGLENATGLTGAPLRPGLAITR